MGAQCQLAWKKIPMGAQCQLAWYITLHGSFTEVRFDQENRR